MTKVFTIHEKKILLMKITENSLLSHLYTIRRAMRKGQTLTDADLSIIEQKISNGYYKLDETNETGNQPLHWAIRIGDPALVEMLVKYGADVNALTGVKNTPMVWTAKEDIRAITIAKILIDNGADVNPKEEPLMGKTPLIFAAQNGNVDLVKFLIANGALLEKKSQEGKTALLYALYGNELKHDQSARILLNAGARYYTSDEPDVGERILMAAAEEGNTELIWTLIQQSSEKGCTTLLDINYLCNTQGVNYITPLDLAKENAHQEVIDLLTFYGAYSSGYLY